MASNHTEHFGLCQWEASDPVLRADFNADNQKLDQAMAGFGNCRMVTGTYLGTGAYGYNSPNALDFADTLGEAPRLLIISSPDVRCLLLARGDTHRYADPTQTNYEQDTKFTWTDTGVSWYCPSSSDLQLNISGIRYTYVALL